MEKRRGKLSQECLVSMSAYSDATSVMIGIGTPIITETSLAGTKFGTEDLNRNTYVWTLLILVNQVKSMI